MLRVLFALACLLLAPASGWADEPKLDELLGRWELTEAAAKLPKGTVFDFRKDGRLVVAAEVGGEKKTLDAKYELRPQANAIAFTANGNTDTSTILTLTEKELVLQDRDGTTPKFRRAK